MANTESPANRREPHKSSHSTAQAENTSVRLSTASLLTCSGAMYGGLPLSMPNSVTGACRPRISAMPKSSTLTVPS